MVNEQNHIAFIFRRSNYTYLVWYPSLTKNTMFINQIFELLWCLWQGMNSAISSASQFCPLIMIAVLRFRWVLFNMEDHFQCRLMEKNFLYQFVWHSWESDETPSITLLRLELETYMGKLKCTFIIILVSISIVFQVIYLFKGEHSIQ